MITNKKNNLNPLLLENPISYYWIGFLLADGHFGQNNVLKVTLSSIDKNHLHNLKNFLNIKHLIEERKGKYLCLKAMDSNLVPQIKNKFDISNRKTYNPPNNLNFIYNKDLLISLIIGFIDGDGCIMKKNNAFSLTVKCHGSWLNNLDFFAKEINPETNAKINNCGYAYFTISNVGALQNLKKNAIRLNLPVLERKWSKIDLDYIKNKEAHERNFITFEKLFKKFKNFPFFKEKFNTLVYGK